jgi:lia operon protein LiaG
MAGFYLCRGDPACGTGRYEQTGGFKMKRTFSLAAILLFSAAAVFAAGRPELVYERTFSLEGINSISIDYSSGGIVFREGADNTLSFREYLNDNNEAYFARSSATGGIITIETGRRPWFRHLRARLEVYLPRSFGGDCRVSLGSGSLEAETGITVSGAIDIALSSGNARLRTVNAGEIKLRSQSGSVHAEGLYGKTDLRLSSGSLYVSELHGSGHEVRLSSGTVQIDAASGAGRFSSSSGSISLGISRLEGDLAFELSSGSLKLDLPRDASFFLDAETSSGRVVVESGGDIFSVKDRSSILRPVGDKPEFTIRAKLSSGNITIMR